MQTLTSTIRLWLTALLGLSLCLPAWTQSPPQAQWSGLPLGQVRLGGEALRIISARTERERLLSLTKYQALLPGEGVLHIYPASGKRCLLTRDIPIELDAAYLDAHNRVLEVGSLIAAHSQAQCAENPAQQVLTVQRGRLAALGVQVGDTLPAVQPLDAQALAQETAAITAHTDAMRAQQAAQEAQDRQAPPRVALNVGGRQMEPLLVFLHRDGGMDSEREAAKAPLQDGWLYVFEHELLPGTCRSADQIHNPLWEPFKYRQYAFGRDGRFQASRLRDDGKLCAGEGGMRYALVMPHRAPVLPDNGRLQLAPAMQAIARQRFSGDLASVHRSGHYRYTCNDGSEQVETLLTIEGSAPDGSVRALADMYLFHHGRHEFEHIKAELQGHRDDNGQYVFTPDTILKAATRYQLQRMSDAGARPLDHLHVAMRGLQCQADAADFAYAGSDQAAHATAVAAAFDAVSEGTAGDGQFFADNYTVQIVRYELGSSRVGGGQDRIPGFLDAALTTLFGGEFNLKAWAYQCSNRSYHVTIRPKRDIPYAGSKRYPFKMPVTWRLVQALSGGNSHEETSREFYQLPARMADSVSETVSFGCVDEYHTIRGTEQSAQLRLDVGETSRVVHRAEWTRAINHNAVSAENSRQWASLTSRAQQAGADYADAWDAGSRQAEQDEANRKLADELKRAQEKAAACARERARNGGESNWFFSNCN